MRRSPLGSLEQNKTKGKGKEKMNYWFVCGCETNNVSKISNAAEINQEAHNMIDKAAVNHNEIS